MRLGLEGDEKIKVRLYQKSEGLREVLCIQSEDEIASEVIQKNRKNLISITKSIWEGVR